MVMEKNLTQLIRLADVLVIAPALFNYSRKPELKPRDKKILSAIAAGTLLYNGYNFLKNL